MVIKLWCLPKQTEDEISGLFTRIVDMVVDLKIGVESETDMLVLFPPDTMTGLGSEILVEISNVPEVIGVLSGDDARKENARRYDATTRMI